MKFKTVVYPTPKSNDSDDVRWEAPNGSVQGYGFIPKEGEPLIHVVRCPRCHNENYMSQPVCISCGFSPNPKPKEEDATH